MTLPFSKAFGAKPREDRHLFCVKTAREGWSVQRYPPLIDLHAGMVVEQASYDGARLEVVRIRQYGPQWLLTFEYRFDEAGTLSALHGSVRRWGRWIGEADLFPHADGTVGPVRVKYYAGAGGTSMSAPEDGAQYEPLLKTVSIYRTVREIPCAGMLEEAEKMNATQE